MSNSYRSRMPPHRCFAVLCGLGFALGAGAALASPVGELEADDLEVVESLALYDEALRRDALVAAGEPGVMGALVEQQKRSSAAFRQLLESYDRPVQEDLFELARYPDLVAEIVAGGPKSQAQLESLAQRYPEDVAAAAVRSGHEHWKLVARTDALLRDETGFFEATIAHLSDAEREAFRSLIAAPDLLALLAENTRVSVLLGDAYDREPDEVMAWLADLEQGAQERGSTEANELAQAVEDDEELAREIEVSTNAYEASTGYSAYRARSPATNYVSVNVSPFPYWIGHPWWYASTYSYYDPWYFWYPRFAWSLGGSHFGPRFHASFGFGWPHSAFWGWYFHSPRHHSYYPHVSHHAVRHYNKHRRHHRSRARHHDWRRHQRRHARPGRHAIANFVRESDGSMPRGFLRKDGRRVDRIREFGRLHEDGERRDHDRRSGRDRVRRAEHRGDGDRDLIRRARADGKRYPNLAELSRDPDGSRGADRRERKRDKEFRIASRTANPSDARRGRGARKERAEARGGESGEVRQRPSRRARRGGGDRGGDRVDDREGDRDENAGRSARRSEKRDRDGAAKENARSERHRADKRTSSHRAERRRESKRAKQPAAARPEKAPRAERRKQTRAAPTPKLEKQSAPRAERASSPSKAGSKRGSKNRAKRQSRRDSDGSKRSEGRRGGGGRGGRRGR